jgi:hypothetical protein
MREFRKSSKELNSSLDNSVGSYVKYAFLSLYFNSSSKLGEKFGR